MGIRESLTVNFEDKTLEYLDMMLYVTKQFEYKNKTYLYCVKSKNLSFFCCFFLKSLLFFVFEYAIILNVI